MRRAHLSVGVLGVLAFLGTGLYMRASFPDLYAGNEALRFMYRANHIYLFLASVLNLAMGVHLVTPNGGWKAWVGRIGLILVLAAPAVLLGAFCLETPTASPRRIITLVGVSLAAMGVVLQLPQLWKPPEVCGG